MSVTRSTQPVPVPDQAPINQAVGRIAGGDLDGAVATYVLQLDENDPTRKVAPTDQATLLSVLTALGAANAVLSGVLGAVARGTKTLTAPPMGTAARVALAANTGRKEAVLLNAPTNTQTIYIGPAAVSTSAYMQALGPGESWIDSTSNDAWYGVVAAGSATLAVTETA